MGAVVVTMLDNWLRGIDLVGNRFNTVIGAIFLAIVLVTPGGLMGIWGSAISTPESRFGRGCSQGDPRLLPHRGRHPAGDPTIVP